MPDAPGYVRDRHYTSYVDEVKELRRQARDDEAIGLLFELVSATEAEAHAEGSSWGVAPWYYEQLAIAFRKRGELADEVEILERYFAQQHAPEARPPKLIARLETAKRRLGAD